MRRWLVAPTALLLASFAGIAFAQRSTVQDLNSQSRDEARDTTPSPDTGRNPQVDPKGPIPLGQPIGGEAVDPYTVTIGTPIGTAIGHAIYSPQLR